MTFRIITFFVFSFSQLLIAQDSYFKNYTIEDGLPTSNVYSVFQEENGIIWFTTDVGIVKYNSKKFELFNTDNGLSDNEVFKMNVDFKGRIWMQTLNGKPCFILKDKIYNNQNNAFLKKIKSNGMCIDFYKDSNNTIHLTYRNGNIISIDNNNTIQNNYVENHSLAGCWINNGELFTIGSGYIYNIWKNKKIKKIFITSPPRIFHLKNETLFSISNTLYSTKNNNYIPILKLDKSQEIINVIEESNNSWWICTRKGVLLYKNGSLSKPFFEDYIVSSILKDFENNYWLSTLNKGVLFVPSLSIKQFLFDKKIKCLATNDDGLWIGGEFNDYYYKKKDKINYYNLNSKWKKDKISNIRFYNNNKYIIGKSGLKIISKTKDIEYNLNINDLLIQDYNYFLGTTFTAKLPIDKFNKSNLDTIYKNSILYKRTNVLCKGEQNDTWIGTNFGLFKYNPKDSITDFGKKNDILSNSIEDIFLDKTNKTLIIATASKGIILLKNNVVYKKFNLTNGLNSNTCTSIKKLKNNFYFIGTNNGLNLIDLNNSKIRNLNPALGIKNKRIKDIEIVNDTTYLATDTGVLSFNVNYINSKIVKPKCIITSLKNEDGEINTKISDFKKRDVSITYNGISFIDNGDVEYFYKLDSQDDKWTLTKESQVNYKSLPAKKYIFQVYCINGFGIKSDIQKIAFEIIPPFWQKLWFKIFIFLIISFLIFLFIRVKLKKQQIKFDEEKLKIQIERDKANLEKQMIELEQKALRMQMNPHFIFNALNTIKGYYSEGNDEKAGDYISNFSLLLRMLLENTEPVIPLSTELKMLKLYIDLTKIRYKNSFEYKIIVAKNVSEEETAIPTLLLQPMVENAIIHGLSPKKENGILLISFAKINNQLECIVEDNGIGRKASLLKQKHKLHESKAIEITKDRLKLLENETEIKTEFTIIDLSDQNNNGIGTKVIIKIPYNNIW